MAEKAVALYHRVMRHENFEAAAMDLFRLLQAAQIKEPNRPRILYVDIDGHRNKQGGFDQDMFELQQDFGLGFLLKYFTEVHFPLASVKNTKGQCNDIPDTLEITENEKEHEASLNELFIENYSNTEFVYEDDVYAYLKKVSKFIKNYNRGDYYHLTAAGAEYDPFGLLAIWRRHMKEIISELFTVFVGGNFLSAAAVTRTLIECYIYISIFKKKKSEKLLSEWYIWSMINSAKRQGTKSKNKYEHILEEHCKLCGTTFEEKWEHYQKAKGMYAWLKSTIGKDRISASVLCEYLDEPEIYEDYQIASAFVHGQDVVAKQGPFTFYNSICATFYMMMSYIFKTIRLFPLREDMKEELDELKKELVKLCKKYYK